MRARQPLLLQPLYLHVSMRGPDACIITPLDGRAIHPCIRSIPFFRPPKLRNFFADMRIDKLAYINADDYSATNKRLSVKSKFCRGERLVGRGYPRFIRGRFVEKFFDRSPLPGLIKVITAIDRNFARSLRRFNFWQRVRIGMYDVVRTLGPGLDRKLTSITSA